MSRLSEVKDLKENQKQFIDAVAALGNLESLDATNKAIIGDIFIKCSEPLAEIANTLEEIKRNEDD